MRLDNFNAREALNIKKIIDEEKALENAAEQNNSIYKGLVLYKSQFDLFNAKFLRLNPDCTEEDLAFALCKKRGIKYYSFDRMENYNMPNGICAGQILLRRRKTFMHVVTHYILCDRKIIKIYQDLKTIPIGVIPISGGKYILVTRPRTDFASRIAPIIAIGLFVGALIN